MACFNTQPPEDGWISLAFIISFPFVVSTHSRPKTAGSAGARKYAGAPLFQHTAARRRLDEHLRAYTAQKEFQHTAARRRLAVSVSAYRIWQGFNTQPPEDGWVCNFSVATSESWFQHTAARRRLAKHINDNPSAFIVSTHSRPKTAGASLKSLAPSGFAAPISLDSQEKREREYNTAFSVTPAFAIS